MCFSVKVKDIVDDDDNNAAAAATATAVAAVVVRWDWKMNVKINNLWRESKTNTRRYWNNWNSIFCLLSPSLPLPIPSSWFLRVTGNGHDRRVCVVCVWQKNVLFVHCSLSVATNGLRRLADYYEVKICCRLIDRLDFIAFFYSKNRSERTFCDHKNVMEKKFFPPLA